MVTQQQQIKKIERENINLLESKFKVGEDFILDGEWGEIKELLSSGNILIEFPNRRRQVITNTQLKEGGLI